MLLSHQQHWRFKFHYILTKNSNTCYFPVWGSCLSSPPGGVGQCPAAVTVLVTGDADHLPQEDVDGSGALMGKLGSS